MNTPLDIQSVIFAGTPAFAASSLQAVIELGIEVKLVLTQPDRPSGRGKKIKSSAVKQIALEHDIPIAQPEALRSAEIRNQISTLNPDLIIVVAYGLIIPTNILSLPKFGCINVHASLLPRWRGAAPIQRAIEAGDAYTGVCIMQMEAGLDTGPVLSKASVKISDTHNSGELEDELALLGAALLKDTLVSWHSKTRIPQTDSETTYANKILKAETQINWHLDANHIVRKIRAFKPRPICFTTLTQSKQPLNLKIWSAQAITQAVYKDKATSEQTDIISGMRAPGTVLNISASTGIDIQAKHSIVRLLQIQLPGTKPMDIRAFVNGYRDMLSVGMQLGNPNEQRL